MREATHRPWLFILCQGAQSLLRPQTNRKFLSLENLVEPFVDNCKNSIQIIEDGRRSFCVVDIYGRNILTCPPHNLQEVPSRSIQGFIFMTSLHLRKKLLTKTGPTLVDKMTLGSRETVTCRVYHYCLATRPAQCVTRGRRARKKSS